MAINTKTYISRSNTIIRGNQANTGLNPVMELNYGKDVTRGIIYFDHTHIRELVEDKTYADMSRLKHVLRMKNASSVTDRKINCLMHTTAMDGYKQRAISFDIILFLIPNAWDEGRGFDYSYDLYNGSHRSVSTDGSNWYKYRNYCKWDEEGIYSDSTLSHEVDLYTSPKGNHSEIIVGWQHFDHGNESLEIDITDTVNRFITGELCNYGLGIAFSPAFEQTETEQSQYVGFFTHHTNSFYEPYVETTYDDTIQDDRSDFYLDKDNRLYFYASVGGKSVNLDELPTCTLLGQERAVKQAGKGVYYIDANLSSDEYDSDTMFYDTWSNIIYNGRHIKDVELYFTTKASENYFSFGLPTNISADDSKFDITVSGINSKEQMRRGDIRKVTVNCHIPYTKNQQYAVDGIQYRLYTMEGPKELDVIAYSDVERGYNTNYFLIDTSQLIPSRYYIDIKVEYDREIKHYRNLLEFEITKDVTEVYV